MMHIHCSDTDSDFSTADFDSPPATTSQYLLYSFSVIYIYKDN